MDVTATFSKYIGLPYKHLGNDTKTGIDCFNLCCHILEKELNIIIPYRTADLCSNLDVNWFTYSSEFSGDKFLVPDKGWLEVTETVPFTLILMSLGSSNCVNHSGLYIGNGKIIQIMHGYTSWIGSYGTYMKSRTVKKGKWIGLNN
jgi:cell wall-associated NlpC family hydrolase